MTIAAAKVIDPTEVSDTSTQAPIQLNITSEIAPLQSVLLYRPSNELDNLTPDTLEQLLFDDIPFMEMAQQEHDHFAQKLNTLGASVYYLEDLITEVFANKEIQQHFIEEFLRLSSLNNKMLQTAIIEYLSSQTPKTVTQKLISGIKKDELHYIEKSFSEYINRDYLFALPPIPNLYFARDPAFVFGDTVTFNNMFSLARKREALFTHYIFKYHPKFKHNRTHSLLNGHHSIEGGDVLILNSNTLAIGISQRTEAQAVESFAQELFFGINKQSISKILVFHIPSSRAFMHLDTVLTQVDYDKFAIHQGVVGHTNIYQLTANNHNRLQYHQLSGSINSILSNELGYQVQTFECGGYDIVSSRREQWSDGANTLAVKPGEVLVYRRNKITNKILQDNGITVHAIPCSELSRGRGGPRCMSMPLVREDLKI